MHWNTDKASHGSGQQVQPRAGEHAASLDWVRSCGNLEDQFFGADFMDALSALEYQGHPIMKHWTVLTSNRQAWMALQRKCPGRPDHLECRGPVAQASSYYPKEMVRSVCKAVIASWTSMEDVQNISMAKDIQCCLLEIEDDETMTPEQR